MWKLLQTFNLKSYFSSKFTIKGGITFKMFHAEAIVPKAQVPIHVATRIPDIHKCLKTMLPNANIETVLLQNECPLNVALKPDLVESLSKAEIMICDNTILAEILPHVPNLKWAHCTWAGVEPIISAVKTNKMQSQFVLTRHSGRAFGTLMAEYVICQIINWERCMHDLWKNQHKKTWGYEDRFMNYRPLSKLVISILGVGNMGCSIANFLKKFGAVVLGMSRSPKTLSEYPDFDLITTNIMDILPQCDYLCNALPSTQDTFHFLDGDVLSKCVKKPIFMNVGRGNIIQEKYLVQALRNEWISGAILDVFEEEPLSESSALWSMPQVVITPHVACSSLGDHIIDEFVMNYNRFLSDEKLKYTVDWDTGY